MKKSTRITLLSLSLSFILSCWGVIADNTAIPTPVVEYHRYDTPADPDGQMYHRFLPPVPERSFYDTRLKVTANIDDTPEKETVVSILEDGGRDGAFEGNWTQAYLLITATEAGVPKKKKLFKVFDAADHTKSIELHPPPFIFDVAVAGKSHGVPIKFIDLTGDGILDIWVEPGNMVVVISFQYGEFKEIFRSYTYTHRNNPAYVDIDNDGIYELRIPNRVYLDGFFRSAHPVWMNLYEWDGTTYVLNNEKFYAQDNEVFFRLLSAYNNHLRIQYKYQLALKTKDPVRIQRADPVSIQRVDASRYFEVYDFFIGLIHYYRGELPRAQGYLQRIATEAKNQDYRKAADVMLKELWNKLDDKEPFVSLYRSHLIRQYGTIPEVDIFIAGKKKIMSDNFIFPADEDEFLKFYEAKYVLWPDTTVLSELDKVRKAKAEGTPFDLIDWDTDEE